MSPRVVVRQVQRQTQFEESILPIVQHANPDVAFENPPSYVNRGSATRISRIT
jgi:hypothetical protein